MKTTLTITREQLAEVVRAIVADVDYDISKDYDPEYEGREDGHPTFDDVAGDAWTSLIELGAVEAATTD